MLPTEPDLSRSLVLEGDRSRVALQVRPDIAGLISSPNAGAESCPTHVCGRPSPTPCTPRAPFNSPTLRSSAPLCQPMMSVTDSSFT